MMFENKPVRANGTATTERTKIGPDLSDYPLLVYSVIEGQPAVKLENQQITVVEIANLYRSFPWRGHADAVSFVAKLAGTTESHVEQALEYLQSTTQ